MAGAAFGGGEDFGYAGVEDFGWGEEGDGVEVSLERDGVAEDVPDLVERGAPVEAEDVAAGLAHDGQEGGGFYSKVDDGDAEGLDVADELGGGGEGVGAVVGGRERADPGVEDLDDVGTGGDLLGGVVGEHGDEFIHEGGPGG